MVSRCGLSHIFVLSLLFSFSMLLFSSVLLFNCIYCNDLLFHNYCIWIRNRRFQLVATLMWYLRHTSKVVRERNQNLEHQCEITRVLGAMR